MPIAIRRVRSLAVAFAVVAALSMSLSGCADIVLREVARNDAPDPSGRVASGSPINVTPDPSIQMSVDVPVTLFTNVNGDAVTPGVTAPSVFTVESVPAHVVAVITYHYVLPSGVPTTGQISLRGPDGTAYGPWPTTGSDGQGGITNANWQADVDLTLPAGTYTVIDSDPATWSANPGTGGAGMFWINGDATAP